MHPSSFIRGGDALFGTVFSVVLDELCKRIFMITTHDLSQKRIGRLEHTLTFSSISLIPKPMLSFVYMSCTYSKGFYATTQLQQSSATDFSVVTCQPLRQEDPASKMWNIQCDCVRRMYI